MTEVPCKSHELIKFCIRFFGIRQFSRLYNCSPSTAYRHARDPDVAYGDPALPNYLDGIAALVRELYLHGRVEEARRMVEFIAKEARLKVVEDRDLERAAPDKDTVEEECLDDYPRLVEFHQAIRDGEAAATIHYLYRKAKAELAETYLKAVETAGEREADDDEEPRK